MGACCGQLILRCQRVKRPICIKHLLPQRLEAFSKKKIHQKVQSTRTAHLLKHRPFHLCLFLKPLSHVHHVYPFRLPFLFITTFTYHPLIRHPLTITTLNLLPSDVTWKL